MKVTDLVKTSPSMEKIYNTIKCANERHEFKVFYPHWVYVSDACKLELIRNGFKLSEGEWLKGDHGLIIEW